MHPTNRLAAHHLPATPCLPIVLGGDDTAAIPSRFLPPAALSLQSPGKRGGSITVEPDEVTVYCNVGDQSDIFQQCTWNSHGEYWYNSQNEQVRLQEQMDKAGKVKEEFPFTSKDSAVNYLVPSPW